MSGNFDHYLGTIERPSDAFVLLKQLAEQHDKDAQYMYSQLYATVHTISLDAWQKALGAHASERQTLTEYNAKVKAESQYWLKQAADNGHTLALLEVAESMLLKSYTVRNVDLHEAMLIAERANEANPKLAANLIERLQKRIREY
ncbi:MAG: hypothetical protein AAF465_10220 [Pseudomonadota bacterium]